MITAEVANYTSHYEIYQTVMTSEVKNNIFDGNQVNDGNHQFDGNRNDEKTRLYGSVGRYWTTISLVNPFLV